MNIAIEGVHCINMIEWCFSLRAFIYKLSRNVFGLGLDLQVEKGNVIKTSFLYKREEERPDVCISIINMGEDDHIGGERERERERERLWVCVEPKVCFYWPITL